MRSWGCSPGDGCSSWSRTCSPSPQGGGPRGASQPGPGPHRPSALQPAQEAAPQRCHITVTLQDSSWCCRHHVQVGSRVGWGGRRAGRQLGGSCAPWTQHRYLGISCPDTSLSQAGSSACSRWRDACSAAMETSWRGWRVPGWPVSPQPLPHALPHRSSPSSAAASTTASDTRCPWPARRFRTPQVGHAAARGHGEAGWAKVSSPDCTMTWSGGKGQLSRPVSCNLRERLQLGLLADFC